MLKPLASAIQNYSDLSYVTKTKQNGVKEQCLCGFRIIQLLRKWSLVLMKQGGNLDPAHPFTSVPCDSLRLPSQGVGQPRRAGEAQRTPSLPPFFSDRQLSGSDSFLALAAPG